MKTNIYILLLTALLFTGCASDMTHYYQTVQAANNSAETLATARVTALQQIGQTGGEGAKVAAAIMLGMGGSAQGSAQIQPVPPKSFADSAREWASILVPGAVQLGQSYINNKTAMRQSDNATALGITQSNNATAATVSTNSTFASMAGSGFGALSATAGAGFGANASIAGQIQAPAPNVTTTIGGNGVIGSGGYNAETIGGNGATGGSTYTSNPITGSFNPVDNSQRNPIDNSISGSYNPVDSHAQNNPVTYPQAVP